MELDFMFFAVAIPAVLYAGIDKAGFGSAASVAAAAILALILEPAEAVAIMLPLLIVMDFVALRPNWKRWDPVAARVMLTGTTIGAFVGAALIFVVSSELFRLLIGAIALIFVFFQFARRSGWISGLKPFSRPVGILFAIGAGVTSFIAHAGGPVASIYLLSRNMTKEQYQATTIVTFWVNNLIKIVLYVWLGILSLQTTVAAAYLLPFAVIGTYLGVRLNRIVPEKLYFTLIYVFLTIAGTKLIFDALA